MEGNLLSPHPFQECTTVHLGVSLSHNALLKSLLNPFLLNPSLAAKNIKDDTISGHKRIYL